MQQQGHGGNIWLAGQIYGVKPENIVDFSANINPLGPSPMVLEALKEALTQIRYYPEPQASSLRRKIGSLTGLPEEFLLLGNGAAELIYALGRVLKPQRVLLTVPTFSEYAGGFAGTSIVEIKTSVENDFKPDLEQLYRQLQPEDMVILCNPNNPTGQLVLREDMETLLVKARQAGAWLLVDEAFMDFVYPQQSLLHEVKKNPFLLVLRSLTKFFAIPGLRLGYLAAAPELILKLTAILPPWRVNHLAQVAGMVAMSDTAYVERTRQVITSQRAFLTRGLEQIPGFRPLQSAANFILVDCRGTGCRDREIQAFLGSRGILIRICSNFSSLDEGFFRVAVRSEEENKLLLRQLEEFTILFNFCWK